MKNLVPLVIVIASAALATAATPLPPWVERGSYLVYYTLHTVVVKTGPAVFSETFYCIENYTVAGFNETRVLVEYSVLDTNDTGGRVFPPQGYRNATWVPWSIPLVNYTDYNISVSAYRVRGGAYTVNKTWRSGNATVRVYLNTSYDPATGVLEKYLLEITVTHNTSTTIIRRRTVLIDTNTAAPVEERPPEDTGVASNNTAGAPGSGGIGGAGGSQGAGDQGAVIADNSSWAPGRRAEGGGSGESVPYTVYVVATAVFAAALVFAARRFRGRRLA